MMRHLRIGAMALSLAVGLCVSAAAQTAADSAWDSGDVETAARLYAQRLVADSTDQRALHRMAIIHAWAERYDQSLALFDQLVAIAPENLEGRIDRARTLAWQGDPQAAVAAVEQIIDERPDHLPAYKALAQFASWTGDFEVALLAYDRVLEVAPDDRSIGRDRARVLGWAKRFEQAATAFAALAANDPNDLEALLGLAQVLSWGGAFDSAETVYTEVLAQQADNIEAKRGLARVRSWSGDLRGAEQAWLSVLGDRPDDVPSLVGLAQTLRWQARPGDAYDVIEHAHRLAPSDPDVRIERQWTLAALAPHIAPALLYESDSDSNRIRTVVVRGDWHVRPRINVGAEVTARSAQGFGGERDFWRVLVSGRVHAAGGWAFSLGLGVGDGDDTTASGTVPELRAEIASPTHVGVGGTLRYRSGSLGATAPMIANGVEIREWAVSGRYEPARRWVLVGGVAYADYQGTFGNSRFGGYVGVTRRVGRPWTFGATLLAFGFAEPNVDFMRPDRNDGYFNPDFYSLLEVGGRWIREFGAWVAIAELAPGLQRVGSSGSLKAAARGSARLAYLIGPSREIGMSFAFSSTGLNSFATGDADYRYRQVILSGAWAF